MIRVSREKECMIRTDKKIVGCWVETVERSVEPQRHTALLTVHSG